MSSGIYLVELKYPLLLLSQKENPNSFKVNNTNIKIGMSDNLGDRKLAYEKNFNTDNVIFTTLIQTSNPQFLEKKILNRLDRWRCINPKTGQKLEWLRDISSSEVQRIVYEVNAQFGGREKVKNHPISYGKIRCRITKVKQGTGIVRKEDWAELSIILEDKTIIEKIRHKTKKFAAREGQEIFIKWYEPENGDAWYYSNSLV